MKDQLVEKGRRTRSRLHTVSPVRRITAAGQRSFINWFPSTEVFKVLH